MATTNPLDILLQHDKWATQQLLIACQRLTPEQLSQPFEIGPGSLAATLTHIIAAMNRWNDSLAQRELRPLDDPALAGKSPVELLALHEASATELATLAKAHPLDQRVKRVIRGRDYHLTRGAILTHVTTHGMHHRAQCLNMLRRLGVSPLPPSSVFEWVHSVDEPQ